MQLCTALETEDYINEIGDIIIRKVIGKTWTRKPIESKMIPKTFREDRRTERPISMCQKYGSTSHLAKTCTKKSKINEFKVIEDFKCTEEEEEYDQVSEISEDMPVEVCHIENITALFEATEVHTNLPQCSEDCYNLINIQYSRMCKTKTVGAKAILMEHLVLHQS
ncbi:hypothetical protein O181_037987 [Austropuccinia psidii MF-1]|uniref:Uncharacterized protein n=1 Tax=Austropuccinia psidii MF-1 TaxID=1389203 RepID=A0A9Q3DDV9_9BASI|nr:hypothetical protein [Austropuccinia psidii MF-1]